jgi:hypothetical protein
MGLLGPLTNGLANVQGRQLKSDATGPSSPVDGKRDDPSAIQIVQIHPEKISKSPQPTLQCDEANPNQVGILSYVLLVATV